MPTTALSPSSCKMNLMLTLFHWGQELNMIYSKSALQLTLCPLHQMRHSQGPRLFYQALLLMGTISHSLGPKYSTM